MSVYVQYSLCNHCDNTSNQELILNFFIDKVLSANHEEFQYWRGFHIVPVVHVYLEQLHSFL